MGKSKTPKKNELISDYKMFDKMAKDLIKHQKSVTAIARSIGKKTSTDFGSGLIENLDVVITHMQKAQKELDKARKELKQI
ncbi:MAG: hypothetical protein ACREBF_03230 [Candidatus Micrarchaeales archaeon]